MAGRVQGHSDSECWNWTGKTDRYGYGSVRVSEKQVGAHRVAWLIYRGDIPAKLVVDHLCCNRLCVNPWHMELVTDAVNARRVANPGRKMGSGGTHCKQGHAYADHGAKRQNVDGYVRQACLVCERIRTAKHRAKRRATA
jgi:hypothetical protein